MNTDTVNDAYSHPLAALPALQPLRDLHRANAAFSGLTGVAMAVTSRWLSRQIDLPRPVVVAVGIALVAWAAALVVLAAQPARRLVPTSELVALADGAWVLGSIALILLGDLTGVGTTAVGSAAAVVAIFATEGLVLGRRCVDPPPLRGSDEPPSRVRKSSMRRPRRPFAATHCVLETSIPTRGVSVSTPCD